MFQDIYKKEIIRAENDAKDEQGKSSFPLVEEDVFGKKILINNSKRRTETIFIEMIEKKEIFSKHSQAKSIQGFKGGRKRRRGPRVYISNNGGR